MLTTGSWPAARSAPCALPMELEQCSHIFGEFYKQKHSGRKLSWHSQVRSCEFAVCMLHGMLACGVRCCGLQRCLPLPEEL